MPWLGSRYYTNIATLIAIDALFAVSLNLLLGTTGLVSFGHVAYFGIGAYVCGILMKTYAVPFTLALPAAAVGAALFALVRLLLRAAHPHLLRHADAGLLADRLGDLLQMERRDRRRSGAAGRALSRFSWLSSLPGLGHLRVDGQFYLVTSPWWRCRWRRSGGSSARPSGAC